jgi:hypothetical protein
MNRDGRWIVPILFVISIVMAIEQDVELRCADPRLFKSSRGYVEIDKDTIDLIDGRGLFLHFVSFPKEEQWLVMEYYARFTYLLYPAPVLATDPATTVFTIEQLLNANFDPSAEWLIDHGTNAEATYTWHTDRNSCDFTLVEVGPQETGEEK